MRTGHLRLPFIGSGGHWCGVEEVEIVAAVCENVRAVAASWWNRRRERTWGSEAVGAPGRAYMRAGERKRLGAAVEKLPSVNNGGRLLLFLQLWTARGEREKGR